MRTSRSSGFTLIELMVAVVIIGILAAVAFPSYQEYVRKGKRAEGKTALLKAAQQQERFFTDRNQYAAQAALALASGVLAPAVIIYSGEDANIANNASYTITVTPLAPTTTFTLTAAPNAPFTDPTCGNLTLTSAGVRSWGTSPANPERCRW